MPWRLYTMPIVGSGSSKADPRRPKYTSLLSTAWAMMDYGQAPWCLVADDRTNAQSNTLAANADVSAIPVNLDGTVGAGNLATVVDKLEEARIPAGWVTAGTTWRELVRGVAGLFQFAQRYTAITEGDEIVLSRAALDAQWSALQAQTQADVLATAQSFGYDTSFIVGTTTVRQLLRQFAQEWGARSFIMGGLTF